MSARILFIDIETTPATALVWSLRDQNISIDQLITPTSVLCFSAKWSDGTEVIYDRSLKQDSSEFKKMIRHAHDLLSEADAVCHFNGASFDIPRLNAEFLRLGMKPPPTIPQIDLKKVVMSKFGTTSSKLAFIGPYLKIGEKVQNEGWPLWRGCMAGDADSWEKMEKYNKQDVVLLERLYQRVLPWIDNHPNANLFVDSKKPLCPNCGSDRLQSRGEQVGATLVYQRFQCRACGRWCRSRKRDDRFKAAARR